MLEFIGGKNLFFVHDYASLDEATSDITKLICRKCFGFNFVYLFVLFVCLLHCIVFKAPD